MVAESTLKVAENIRVNPEATVAARRYDTLLRDARALVTLLFTSSAFSLVKQKRAFYVGKQSIIQCMVHDC